MTRDREKSVREQVRGPSSTLIFTEPLLVGLFDLYPFLCNLYMYFLPGGSAPYLMPISMNETGLLDLAVGLFYYLLLLSIQCSLTIDIQSHQNFSECIRKTLREYACVNSRPASNW